MNSGTRSALIPLSNHLENVRHLVNNHHGAEGFSRLLTDLKNPALAMQDGATHMLQSARSLPPGSISRFDYEFLGDGVVCTRCRFDVQLSNGHLIEYKSWSLANIPKLSPRQMVEYFRQARDINSLQYVFNRLKTPDVQAVREQMRMVFTNNVDDMFDAMGSDMRNSLGILDFDDFEDLIADTGSGPPSDKCTIGLKYSLFRSYFEYITLHSPHIRSSEQ